MTKPKVAISRSEDGLYVKKMQNILLINDEQK